MKYRWCAFCSIIHGESTAEDLEWLHYTVSFTPLSPHSPGHRLFVPYRHVTSAASAPNAAADAMYEAAVYAANIGPCNILTSVGAEATQTVMHLHVHVIPRGPDDGLHHDWPWLRSDRGSLLHSGVDTGPVTDS